MVVGAGSRCCGGGACQCRASLPIGQAMMPPVTGMCHRGVKRGPSQTTRRESTMHRMITVTLAVLLAVGTVHRRRTWPAWPNSQPRWIRHYGVSMPAPNPPAFPVWHRFELKCPQSEYLSNSLLRTGRQGKRHLRSLCTSKTALQRWKRLHVQRCLLK